MNTFIYVYVHRRQRGERERERVGCARMNPFNRTKPFSTKS